MLQVGYRNQIVRIIYQSNFMNMSYKYCLNFFLLSLFRAELFNP